jgi:hypothetical protein
MYKQETLDATVEQMRALGEQLVPYNAPENEPDLYVLKTREVTVEGYDVILYYTKSRFDEHATEILQVYGKNMPFLPFYLACKLAKKFLGSKELSLVELFRGNRKVYCWSVNVDDHGRPIRTPYEVEAENCTYEGFRYSYLQPNQVNFY